MVVKRWGTDLRACLLLALASVLAIVVAEVVVFVFVVLVDNFGFVVDKFVGMGVMLHSLAPFEV